MTDDQQDAIVLVLRELRGAAPAAARDALVRARCHAAMTLRAAPGGALGGTPPVPTRSMGVRLVDTALAVGAGLYGILVIAEALRVGWRPLG